jgi:hypothetical protein
MTSTLKLPRDQVEALRPRDVQLYLVSRGWVADPTESSPSATLFHHPELTDAEVLVPLRRDLGDYTLRMADVIQALVVLHRDDYKRACDAHRDEKPVAVTGMIHHDIKLPSPTNRKQRPMSRTNTRLVDAEDHGSESGEKRLVHEIHETHEKGKEFKIHNCV